MTTTTTEAHANVSQPQAEVQRVPDAAVTSAYAAKYGIPETAAVAMLRDMPDRAYSALVQQYAQARLEALAKSHSALADALKKAVKDVAWPTTATAAILRPDGTVQIATAAVAGTRKPRATGVAGGSRPGMGALSPELAQVVHDYVASVFPDNPRPDAKRQQVAQKVNRAISTGKCSATPDAVKALLGA